MAIQDASVNIVFCVLIILALQVSVDGINKSSGEALENQTLWNATHTDKLRKDLFKNYDRLARPSQHYNKTTVRFGLAIIHLEVNEPQSTVNVYGWARLVWTDDKLKWNEEDYGGISVLRVGPHELWKPDIFLYNSAVATPITWSSAMILVYPNGEVLWVPPARFSVLCNLNLKYWPYDQHVCKLVFGSWVHNGEEIDLELYNNEKQADLSDLIDTNNQWKINKADCGIKTKVYKCCKEGYPDMTCNLTITRQSPVYGNVIITPAFVVITNTLLTFWISPHGNGKLYMNGLTLLIIFFFFSYFTQKLPALGDQTPLIISFYSHSLYIVSIAMIEAVIVTWIVSMRHAKPVPGWIKRFLTGKFGLYMGFTDNTNKVNIQNGSRIEEMRDHQVTDSEISTNEEHHIIKSSDNSLIQMEWYSLAIVIDKIMFLFYCFVFLILSIAHSV